MKKFLLISISILVLFAASAFVPMQVGEQHVGGAVLYGRLLVAITSIPCKGHALREFPRPDGVDVQVTRYHGGMCVSVFGVSVMARTLRRSGNVYYYGQYVGRIEPVARRLPR